MLENIKTYKILPNIFISILFFSCTNDTSIRENTSQNINSKVNIDYTLEGSQVIDLQEVLDESKVKNKPILFYFTAYASVNARKMEERVLSDIEIANKIQNDFLFIPLTVDDKTKLPKNQWVKSKITGKNMEEIGTRNNELQILLSQSGTQPYFVIIDWNKNVLGAIEYEPIQEYFLDFLCFGESEYSPNI